MNKNQEKRVSLPRWLWPNSPMLPPLYRRVWDLVKEDHPGLGAQQGELLVDTNKVFPLLLTSQLPMEVLGYIWSLANQKYAGQLTEHELYIVLALVAVAQASCTFTNLDVLHMVPFPPMPKLNLPIATSKLHSTIESNVNKSEAKVATQKTVANSKLQSMTPDEITFNITTPDTKTIIQPKTITAARMYSLLSAESNFSTSGLDGKHGVSQKATTSTKMHSSVSAGSNLGNSSLDLKTVVQPQVVTTSKMHSTHSLESNINIPDYDGNVVAQPKVINSIKFHSSFSGENTSSIASIDEKYIMQTKPQFKPATSTSSTLMDTFTFDTKMDKTSTSVPVDAPPIFPSSVHVMHTVPVISATQSDPSDEFSEFQSAPIPSIPSIPILDTRQGSAIGSRLANHNLGVKKSTEKTKKAASIKSNHSHQNRSSVSVNSVNGSKDLLCSDRLSELFPKCSVKHQPKTVILKDTAIRSIDSPKESTTVFKDFNVTEKIPAVNIGNSMTLSSGDKQPGMKDFSDLAESLSDDFGDFVSAQQPEPAQMLKSLNSGQSLDFLNDFDFPQSTTDNIGKGEISLMQEISESFSGFKIEADQPDDKIDTIAEGEKIMQREDTISVNSIESGNGAQNTLNRSGSVPSLDLKSFLPANQEEEQPVENMHQLIYWEWKQYMESCILLLQVAANIFTSISSDVVLREVLSSATGYNFLCNLAEVAAVCRRVNFSYKEMDMNIMGFDDLLMDIDRIWAEMEPFYANIPIVTELPAWPLHQSESTTCALCLTVVTSGKITYNDNNYHITCAKLWLHCVNNNLPALCYPSAYSHSTISLSSSHI
ncbi:synergin gamma isoform X2 [Cephus cinctus]|uniref:Synergin gamma isoform X2 n=1 Tax=Cephus cinctus TaxID=211228 RepID=A0AAJ7BWN7_CEPCN|nr:synergin gamma isoform X2 [Cephus cinctus]